MKRGAPLKRTTRLKPRSAKMADRYAREGGRRDLVAALLSQHPVCQGQVLCRGARSVDVHERLSRARGGDILDPVQAHMVCLCRACHSWVDDHPREAEERRLLLPSWHRCPPIGPC